MQRIRKPVTGLAFLLAVATACGPEHTSRAIDQVGTHNLEAVVIVHKVGDRDFCSGTILSDRIVLTALHCVQDPGAKSPHPPSTLRVGLGASTVDPDLRRIAVSEVRIADDIYLSQIEDLKGMDVAVLMLATPFEGTPFGLPQQVPLPEVGSKLTLIGFGEDRYGLVGKRHQTTVTVTGSHPDGFTYTGGGCLGDSGGPILNGNGQLIGIVSTGTSQHCTPNFTRIGQPLAPFGDFIVDQLLRGGQNN